MSTAAKPRRAPTVCRHDATERIVRADGSTSCRACKRDRYHARRGTTAPPRTRIIDPSPAPATNDARLYTHEEWKAAFPDEWRRITLGARAPGAYRGLEHDDA